MEDEGDDAVCGCRDERKVQGPLSMSVDSRLGVQASRGRSYRNRATDGVGRADS